MNEVKSVRCTRCRKEFSEAECAAATSCPGCGTTGVPMSIDQDVTIRINWHELRILTIWATNWAGTFPDSGADSREALAAVIRALEAQRPDLTPLTIMGEIQDAVDRGLVSNATVVDGRGTHEIKSKVGKA